MSFQDARVNTVNGSYLTYLPQSENRPVTSPVYEVSRHGEVKTRTSRKQGRSQKVIFFIVGGPTIQISIKISSKF